MAISMSPRIFIAITACCMIGTFSYHTNSFCRDAPILILNRAAQCYFNAGLQCIFATQAFAPWIRGLSSKKCIPTPRQDSHLITSLVQLTINFNAQATTWADNNPLFKAIQAIDSSITPNLQEDVLVIMSMILERLSLQPHCRNPFVMDKEIIERLQAPGKKEVTETISFSIWQTEQSKDSRTNLIDLLQKSFSTTTQVTLGGKKYTQTTKQKITKFPVILCCGITATLHNEKEEKEMKYLERITIPENFFLSESIILETFIPGVKSQLQYKLVGIGWRTTPHPGSTEGHYFATVKYDQSWYILDEVERYATVVSPYNLDRYERAHTIEDLPPTEALKINTQDENTALRKDKKPIYEWTNRTITTTDLAKAITIDGFLTVAGSPALPTFIVYERKGGTEEEPEKKYKSEVVTGPLSESLANLQQELYALAGAIKR